MESLIQEHDDQELLDQQLHDTLFGHTNDAPSSNNVSAQQEQHHSDDDLLSPEDNVIHEPSAAAADESTRSMWFAPSASPAPTSMTPTTPAGQALSCLNTQYAIPPSEMASLKRQVADQPRIPWRWSTTGQKNSSPYKPTAVGKWWYDYWIASQSDPKIESAASHVGRIMKTERGLQLLGDKRCTRCRLGGMECWIYSERGRKQVRHPGSACAHCRAIGPMAEGCSVATRSRSKRDNHRQLRTREQTREILPMHTRSSSVTHEE